MCSLSSGTLSYLYHLYVPFFMHPSHQTKFVAPNQHQKSFFFGLWYHAIPVISLRDQKHLPLFLPFHSFNQLLFMSSETATHTLPLLSFSLPMPLCLDHVQHSHDWSLLPVSAISNSSKNYSPIQNPEQLLYTYRVSINFLGQRFVNAERPAARSAEVRNHYSVSKICMHILEPAYCFSGALCLISDRISHYSLYLME